MYGELKLHIYDKTFITDVYLKIKQKYVIERPFNHNTYSTTYCVQKKTKWIKKCQIKKFKTGDFVVFDAISHHMINKHYKWCYIIIFFFTTSILLKKSLWLTRNCRTWTRSYYQQVYVIKKLLKIKNDLRYWSMVNYLQRNMYIISTCCAEIMASDSSFSSGM